MSHSTAPASESQLWTYMQPHLGIHQNGLTGCNTIDGEYRVHGNIALEQRQTYRTEFVMHGNATELPLSLIHI